MIFGKGKIFHFGPLATSIVAAYGVFLTLPHTGSYAISFLIGLSLALVLSLFFAWLALRQIRVESHADSPKKDRMLPRRGNFSARTTYPPGQGRRITIRYCSLGRTKSIQPHLTTIVTTPFQNHAHSYFQHY